MFTRGFWKATAERSIKTFAQTLVLLWTADAGFNVLSVEWETAAGLGAGAALLSVLTSLASAGVGNSGPSLANEVIVTGRAAR